jgi:hypothetical protein
MQVTGVFTMNDEEFRKVAKQLRDLFYMSGFPKLKTKDEIAELIDKRELDKLRPYEIGSYSRQLAYNEQWDKAEEITELIEDEDEKGQALAGIAQYLAKKGLIERAEQIVCAIPSLIGTGAFSEKIDALIELAKAFAKRNEIEKLKKVIELIENEIKPLGYSSYKAEFINEIAIILEPFVGINNTLPYWEEAIKCIENETDSSNNSYNNPENNRFLAYIADYLAKAGVMELAIKAANVIPNSRRREQVISTITRNLNNS